jgi:hypothetical protein
LRRSYYSILRYLMPRLRAFLAILLVTLWCSAAWHVDLEAVGLMFEHQHHAHDDHDADHAPAGVPHDDHEQVFARDVAKDQIRVGGAAVLWFAYLGLAVWLAATLRPVLVALKNLRQRRETDPPFARVWQFVQRCAPESAAPPVLG